MLTIPYLMLAGTGGEHQFLRLGFILPVLGIAFAFSSFSKSSPIYKLTKDDVPIVVLFAILVILLPLFAHLHEIQKIEIAESLWVIAQVFSVCLGIFTGGLFFRILRKKIGFAIILGLLATSLGGLSGAILFKLISLVMR